MDLSVGFTFDKYCIIRKIAEGGFAAVYEAEDINLSRHVAIKLMLRQASSKEKAIFLQEAKIIANLEHAHIIQIFDFGFLPDGRIYIVMPLVKTNLRERVKKQGPFSLEEVLHSVVPIAEALHHAHTSPWQLVHRDVKPENVLISNRDEILLSDFGISVGTTTGKAVVEESIGTLHSMSPEQFNGKPVRATDQYALGILTYQLFCGKLPFTGNFTHQHAWLGYAALHRQQPVPPFAEKGGKENWEV
jgi:serine/threonine protein kinase